MSVTRTSDPSPRGSASKRQARALIWGVLLAAAAFVTELSPASAQSSGGQGAARLRGDQGITFKSPEVAYDQGVGALKGGNPEIAIKAFEFAARHDMFLAQFALARLYADNSISYTNHARAFELFQAMVTEYADVDVDDDPKAPLVAKAMLALAGYYRTGLTSAGVTPDPEQAANLVRNAAKTFRDEDAQFEYAKLLLTGDGLQAGPREAVYWLRGLASRGHTAAQAFLADLYWRGLHVERDATQALLLITLAAENANAADRIWIEDQYQYIFCGAGEGVRKQAQGAVADWRRKYARSHEERLGRDGLATISPRAVRTCSNGEAAQPQRRGETTAAAPPQQRSDVAGSGLRPAATPPSGSNDGYLQGNTMGFSLRDAGQTGTAPLR